MKSFKEQLKEKKEKYKFYYNFAERKGAETVINHFDNYRAITNSILILLVPLFLYLGYYWQSFFTLLVWHLHCMVNQVWWKLRNNDAQNKENKN